MGSGKGPGFPDDQKAWIKKRIPDYLTKTAVGKKSVVGQPLPKDDPDLKEWVKERLQEFEQQFADNLKADIDAGKTTAAIARTNFSTYFRNQKHRQKVKVDKATAKQVQKYLPQGTVTAHAVTPSDDESDSDSTTTPSLPTAKDVDELWSTVFKRTQLTGCYLHDREHADQVNAEVNKVRKATDTSHHKHAGMWQTRMKELWEGLDEDEQADWEEKAATLRAAQKEGQIYRNQALLYETVAALLTSLVGTSEDGKYTIGNARFHLLYTYRDCNEVLKTGCVNAYKGDIGQASFESFLESYSESVMRPWFDCCKDTVDVNQKSGPFERDVNGYPIWPEGLENDLTLERLRAMLAEFVEVQWASSWSFDGHPFRWDSSDMQATLVDSNLPLLNPQTSPLNSVFQLLTFIKDNQATTLAVQLFKKSPTSVSTGDLQTSPAGTKSPISTPSSIHPETTVRNKSPPTLATTHARASATTMTTSPQILLPAPALPTTPAMHAEVTGTLPNAGKNASPPIATPATQATSPPMPAATDMTQAISAADDMPPAGSVVPVYANTTSPCTALPSSIADSIAAALPGLLLAPPFAPAPTSASAIGLSVDGGGKRRRKKGDEVGEGGGTKKRRTEVQLTQEPRRSTRKVLASSTPSTSVDEKSEATPSTAATTDAGDTGQKGHKKSKFWYYAQKIATNTPWLLRCPRHLPQTPNLNTLPKRYVQMLHSNDCSNTQPLLRSDDIHHLV
ncbi:unnamed protein product [Cyclocybe aegerita]|uniref:Uncharacterized protein n=1 Tax=Cyclocybe aegerita TaxID=1973307 RepID=A0A8S0VRS2_CYCAE|nr:unnamed protein product [Cyclocybe aegerita]